MHSVKIEPKYAELSNPRVGLIALATDFRIEKDFISVIKDQNIDFFVNRIHCYFPLTSENLIKMSGTVTEISKDILPNEKLDCVVYGCTSGTIAAGYENIKKKINLAKPEAEVTTPSTAAINALKKMNIEKIAIFTPYSKVLNDEVIDYFKSENFEVSSNAYFDILSDLDIGKVDEDYLYETLSKMDLGDADALFISCTALPALSIIDKLEKKLNKVVLSSNQVLIWDTLQSIGKKNSIEGLIVLMSLRCFSLLRDVTRRGKLPKFASIKLPCAKPNSLSNHNCKHGSAVTISCNISSASSQMLSHLASSELAAAFCPLR